MASWIIGDIHGCADELAELIRRIAPGPTDALLSCGDILHRGPDPAGVIDLLDEHGARFILGNHERAVLRRIGIAPLRHDGGDRGPGPLDLPPIDAEDLDGDGRTVCHAPAERRADIIHYLQRHSGYLLRSSEVEHAGDTPDGRAWLLVHAGFDPRKRPEDCSVEQLTTVRRGAGRGRPWWYEGYAGPDLVMFGHTHSPTPRMHSIGPRLVALGLDTGCVYGGSLTAYSPELDEFISVPAQSTLEKAVSA